MKRTKVLALALAVLLVLTNSSFSLSAQTEAPTTMEMPPDTENIPFQKEYARSYKIHIATFGKSADKDWLIRNANIDELQDLGQIYWQEPYQGVVRVYLGNFSGKKTVEKVLAKVQDRGYEAAKIAVYQSHYSIVLWEDEGIQEGKIVSVYEGNGEMTPIEASVFQLEQEKKDIAARTTVAPAPTRGGFSPPMPIVSRNPIILDIKKPKNGADIQTDDNEVSTYEPEEEDFMEWQVIDETKTTNSATEKIVKTPTQNAAASTGVTNKWLANKDRATADLTTAFGESSDLNPVQTTFYVVQIGAFSKKRSLKTNTFLPLKNIAAVYKEDAPKYNKVVLGPFSDKKAAQTAMKTVKSYNYDAFMRPVKMATAKDISAQMQLLGMQKLF